MTKWISENTDTPVAYHTSKDCKSAGDDLRKVTEADERRHIRMCSYCRGANIPVLD